MKKLKGYFVIFFSVLCISILGIVIGIGFAIIQEEHPEYLSIGLLKGTILFIVALMFSVYLHESVHAIVYKLQGVDIRMMYVFPICIVKEDGRYQVSVAFDWQIGFGGIVIPKISSIGKLKKFCL